MRRERLRSKYGCLRCKQRHTKCDEKQPTCSFCRRWGLSCVWPEDRPKLNEAYSAPTNPYRPSKARQEVLQVSTNALSQQIITAGSTYPLVGFVGHERHRVAGYLHEFFNVVMHHNLPFEDNGAQNVLTPSWFESAMLNQVVCYSLLTQWAKQNTRLTGSPVTQQLSLQFETKTTSLIRRHLQSNSTTTEGILLAAAVHYMSAAMDMEDGTQLRRMLRGIKALIDDYGGIMQVNTEAKPGTVFAVHHTDIMCSLVNADKPLFVQLMEPERPSSFVSAYSRRVDQIGNDLIAKFESDVLNLIELVEFVLYFRLPSQQSRSLSQEELRYLHSLDYWLNYRLILLQNKYANRQSTSEIMVVSMIIVKLEIIAEGSSHSVLILAILGRLQAAIQRCCDSFSLSEYSRTVNDGFKLLLAMWACLVALVNENLSEKRVWFKRYFQLGLTGWYGAPGGWRHDVEDDLRARLQLFPWHQRIDLRLVAICRDLRNESNDSSLMEISDEL